MDLVTRNVLRHVYEALLARKRQADSGNISNLQLFYNRLISEYCASEKRGQCLVVPLTGQDVDDFYSRKMPREMFVELVRTKVIAKLPHFDPSVLQKLCWECFCESHDTQLTRAVTLVTKQSATLLWLIFCKLDTEGKLKLHPEDVIELIIHLFTHLRVTPDRKTVEVWLGDQVGSLTAWVNFWSFFIVIVDKCLAPRGAQATSRGVQALYDEVVDEVMKSAQMTKKGHLRHTWKMRWFVLTTTDLFYYESKESLVKKGAVVLNAHASVEVMQDKNVKDTRYPNRFKVVDGISQQITEISAESLTQMNEWVEAINTAIRLNSVEGRNYIHRLQLVQSISFSDGQHGGVKSPVMHSYSVQPSSKSSMDTVSELSGSSGNNKISRKISLPVMNTSPPPIMESREAVSANSSQTDLYAVVDKTKKMSAPNFAVSSTRPVRKHDYEDIRDEDFPPKLPPPYQPMDAKSNGSVPPKIPAPYQGSNSVELNTTRKLNELHSKSDDISSPSIRGNDPVLRHLKSSNSADGYNKRHSSIIDEDDYNRTYSSISDEKPDIRRSHTPDIGLVMPAKVPEIPSHRKHSPPTVPKHGSPLASRRQLAVDSSTPPSLPPKKGHSVEYVEVSKDRVTTFATVNGGNAIKIHETKDSSYADLDFSQLPPPAGGNTSAPPVDYMKRDYADIDFATTQKLEKSILLKDETANASHVILPPKGTKGVGTSKNTGSSEDTSGYVKVDYPNNREEDRSGQPRQMMIVQPQQSGRMSPLQMKANSFDIPPSRPIPAPRGQTNAPSIPPHHSKNPPPLPPKQTLQ